MGSAAAATAIAFVTPLTPCEQAWADLCDECENADVERIVAATGGWEAWLFADGQPDACDRVSAVHGIGLSMSYIPFTAAFNGDYAPLLAERRERAEDRLHVTVPAVDLERFACDRKETVHGKAFKIGKRSSEAAYEAEVAAVETAVR